ncbi:hypothetical protein NDU88_001164 [Pleurodeles waltl]|uniref:Uncharacterized protein n=1 Tax=Pleurodeles waltl TaxID=8319 RepID=A0AAV7SBL3_PLEWA|nr:hypothetical protein NDU88_001164 [Pleurodeles waltl]
MGPEPWRISISAPADKTLRDWDRGPALRTKKDGSSAECGYIDRSSSRPHTRGSENQKRNRRCEAVHVAQDGQDRTVAETRSGGPRCLYQFLGAINILHMRDGNRAGGQGMRRYHAG